MSSTIKAARALEFFKAFDASTAHRCNQEHVLYVQPALFPFGLSEDEEHETWYCMFTTQRFIICRESEGMITERKQLNYQNIKQFKLKKNKRFKKSNLPSIKVYINIESAEFNPLKTVTLQNLKSSSKSEEDKPKVVISFKENEERDSFYTKMLEIIGSKRRRRSKSGYKSHSATETENDIDKKIDKKEFDLELYQTLDIIIYNQDIYNEYLSIRDSHKIFRFLDAAKHQSQQMTNINDVKYVFKLNNDDVKHIKAYYRSKQDNFEIRNNRKQWFINCWIATKLFRNYFPIAVSSEIEWIWIQSICRSSIYFMNDVIMNRRCIEIMDILMKECFCNKYIKPIDTLFHEKDYQNLQILYHLMSNYINLKTSHSQNLPKLRYKQMIPLLILNNANSNNCYFGYFVDLINIVVLKKYFNESDIYQCIIKYIECNGDDLRCDDIDNDPIIIALIQILKKDKKISKIWPQHSLYLQEIIESGKDQNSVLKRLKVSLMISPSFAHKIYPNKYDGMSALECAHKKYIWPKVIEFMRSIDITPGEKEEEKEKEKEDSKEKEEYHQEGDDNKSFIPINKERASSRLRSPPPPQRQPTSTAQSPSMISWGFSSFVGKCFSFTQLTSSSADIKKNSLTLMDPHHYNQYEVERKLQSYISSLDKFKAKTRSLEHKIAKLNKAMDKQNEKIIELKLENKMLKNVFLNNEYKNSQIDDDEKVNKTLIQSLEWKSWSYLEIIHWICDLHHGRFKKYKNTLKVNLKLRNIKGIHLERMDKSDLTYFYGIVDFDDVQNLYQEIEDLVTNNYTQQML